MFYLYHYKKIKGGRGGGPRLSVPSPDASPCHGSLSIRPRPTITWRSGADCATSFSSRRRFWIRPLNFFRPWKGTILLSHLSSCLEDLRASWGVSPVSDRSFRLFSAGWKRSSEDRYERAWQSCKAFLRSSSIPLHQVSLKTILDYLTHLYDRGLSWSTIGIHKSTISMTMAPIDGTKVGDHPLVKRLMSGIFNDRPSRRANPALWDPLKVLSVFQHWPVSLPLSSLMRVLS
jgi:hypothetical protein